MSILNSKGVNKLFSDAVSKYINNGYVISPFTECDFGRTVKSVTLVNKSKAICVSLRNDYSYNHEFSQRDGSTRNFKTEKFLISEMSGKIKEYNGYLTTERFYVDKTINETVLYRYKKNVFCESTKDLESIALKKFERDSNNTVAGNYKDINVNSLPSTFVKKVLPKIQNVRGFRKATEHCITGVTLVKNPRRGICANVFFTFKGKEGMIVLQ